MTKKTKQTTRREFLKTSGKIAGTVILSSISGGCLRDAPKSKTDAILIRRTDYKIFSTGQIGAMTVKNRLVRSATMVAAGSDGQPTQEHIRLYCELARGGVAVIITGFMLPSRNDKPMVGQIVISEDSYIPGLERLAEAVHETDGECRLVAQIGHSGMTVSPSGIKWPFRWTTKGRTLTTDEVDNIVADFSDAIWRAKTAGFDGVELHGAHAYLLSSFLSPQTNKRTDKYGGSIENRVHIIRAIMDKARKRAGPDFPIMIKLNSDDNTAQGIQPTNFPDLANEIIRTGVVALDVSGNNKVRRNIENTKDEAYFFTGAKALDVRTPIILTGGNRSVNHMEKLLKTNEIDFIGMARPLIREPNLPNRWLEGVGEDRASCISCNGCIGAISKGKTAYCTQDA
jgi:2,4-dienoyl-CoA reductase-like NADH-dependent reductase (Old Yellow Enzyme family)